MGTQGENAGHSSRRLRCSLVLIERFCGVRIQVSGLVVALKGAETKKGIFVADGVCAVCSLPQLEYPILEHDVFICLVSGLSFGDERRNPLDVELLLETLKGSSVSNDKENAQLAHVIVAGEEKPIGEDSALS